MGETARRNWREDELVEVLSLYCQLAFGQMHGRNPVVVDFAGRLGRTPSAVAMKLVNFASFDPALQARGIRGMSNASRLDRQVWDAYYGRWEALASADIGREVIEARTEPRATTAERLTTVRIGQGFFRNAVLSAYDGVCCITGIANRSLLRASHIVPWSVSEEHRLNPGNGLCLSALHDAAFDRGLIAVDPQLKIHVAAAAQKTMPDDVYDACFRRYDGQQIQVPERFRPDGESLQYHLDHIFDR